MPSPSIMWFRRDLRLQDNRALTAAAADGPVLPVYIHDPESEAPWAPGGASNWWLHHSLVALDAALRARGSRLLVRRGPTQAVLARLAEETGARAIHWNRLYEPATIRRDTAIKQWCHGAGIRPKSHAGYLLFEPTLVQNKQGTPFKVFTPFWRHLLTLDPPPEPLPIPTLEAPAAWPASDGIDSLGLLPRIPWDAGFSAEWEPGEPGAQSRLQIFLDGIVAGYHDQRDLPGIDGTSRLSPALHFGELTPAQIWHRTHSATEHLTPKERGGAEHFLREVGWREFSAHLLYHFPSTDRNPLRPEFEQFPWKENLAFLKAWQRGQTGYPIVDAGMRQLWQTGWMHNRVRMIVASFLVKHLLVSWQRGAEWFWDTLVDADRASNTMGWQWTAGCGADAAPYFRIFNPMMQAAKFDPDGQYIRRFVPELAALPDKFIHAPWEAPVLVLKTSGVELGTNYPRPIVDHQQARDTALGAFAMLKRESEQ
ncbi:deoxyribodipyrimidine photo-lyase [bacterium]|nr:deoxyribodipyrimidine photo-lyase [bacterium]